MAQMIPPLASSLRRMSNPGERQVARLLQNLLGEDCLIWYDIPVGKRRRYPDFIILHPERGLLFLEVKDWKPGVLKRMSQTSVTLQTEWGRKEQAHPLDQARQAANQAVHQLLRSPSLRNTSKRYEGSLLFPYGHGVVFSNLRRDQLGLDLPDSARSILLPDQQVMYRDDLADDQDSELFRERLWRMFTVSFPCRLSSAQIDAVRWHLFPEIRIGEGLQTELFSASSQEHGASEMPSLMKVMDLQQEVLARSLGKGHRVIHGVAGSGKTLILGYRCQYLADSLDHPILVLCFNIVLAAKLRSFIAVKGISDKVQVQHFHGWCKHQLEIHGVKAVPGAQKPWESQVASVIQAVADGRIPTGQYGAVLIDEGHDFEAEWLRLIARMVDPCTESLLLLYDDAQSIYKKRSALKFSLSSVGIQAQGRSTVLRLNYRNSREILEFAYRLTESYLITEGSEDIPLVQPEAAGLSGMLPVLKRQLDLEGEILYAVRCLQHWHEQGRAWRDMAVLYPRGVAGSKLAQELELAAIPHVWLGDPDSRRRYDAQRDQVAVMTLHSSKGLEFSTVLLIDASNLWEEGNVTQEDQMRLLYVGCTRARENLLVSYHKENAISEALERVASGASAGNGGV